MFIIINGQLQGSNEIKVYESLTADLTFNFKGSTFDPDDTFELKINSDVVINQNYGFYKHGLITFAKVDFSSLTSENEVNIKIFKNDSAFWSEDFTVTFLGGGVERDPYYTSDAANLATKSYVGSAVQSATAGLATETYVGQVVSSAVTGLATESYVGSAVSSAVAGLASESYVSSAVNGLASEAYVSSAVSGLATENYVGQVVSSATADMATQAYVSSATAGLATEAYVGQVISSAGFATQAFVTSAITSSIGDINTVLDSIIGSSSSSSSN